MTTQTREVLQQLTAARDRDYIIAKLKRTQGELNDAVDQALILLDLPHGTWIKYCFYTEAKDGIAWQCSQCGGLHMIHRLMLHIDIAKGVASRWILETNTMLKRLQYKLYVRLAKWHEKRANKYAEWVIMHHILYGEKDDQR